MRQSGSAWHALVAACCLLGMPALAASIDPLREVDTFIGTRDEGNTFPGASAPFGMIQVSPITDHYAGYRYDDPKIRGFGHSFVSGAGCWEQGGQVAVLPVTGTIGPGGDFDTDDKRAAPFDYKAYASAYTHQGEVGQAGYYKVLLTDRGGIDAEMTALTRAAAERYSFAANAKTGHLLVNLGQANEKHEVVGSDIQVVGDRAVEGRHGVRLRGERLRGAPAPDRERVGQEEERRRHGCPIIPRCPASSTCSACPTGTGSRSPAGRSSSWRAWASRTTATGGRAARGRS